VVCAVLYVVAGHKDAVTFPDGYAPAAVPPRRGRQGWLRHKQQVVGKRSLEYQTLLSANLIDTGNATPRIDDPCTGQGWNRQYHAWRHLLHRLSVTLALHLPRPFCSVNPRERGHESIMLSPGRVGSHGTGTGGVTLVLRRPGGQSGPAVGPGLGEEDNAVLPDLVREACGSLVVALVRGAFATPTNHRFPAFWTKADDAFARAWTHSRSGAL